MNALEWLLVVAAWSLGIFVNVCIWRYIAKWKRPARCGNCGTRPRWAFDQTPHGGPELLRDHMKECLA